MPAFILSHPTTSPTTTLTFLPSLVSLTNPQRTFVQHFHVATGGNSYVFSPGGATLVSNQILPVDIRWLPEDDGGGYTGWAALRTFIRTTLEAAKEFCTLVDPDGDSYTVRYLRGVESMVEVQLERWSGTLVFRQEPS